MDKEEEKKEEKKERQESPKRKNIIPSVNSTVEITFKESRKFDLHIGRDLLVFRGREKKRVPTSWIEHKDFEVIKHLFVIRKGV